MMALKKAPPGEGGAIGEETDHMSRDDAAERGFEQFERFLDEWSRRDFLRRMGGAAAFTAFGGGIVGFLDACASTPTTPTSKAVKGGHIVEGNSTDIRNFNSVLVTDVYSSTVNGLLFDSLVQVDGKGNVIPCLAKDLPKLSSDSLTYTFNLRQDVKWTDGSPLTADDVVFTYKLMYDDQFKDVKSPRRGDLSTYVQSVTAQDKYTVVIQTKKVFAPFVASHGTYGILPKKAFDGMSGADINNAKFNSEPTLSHGVMKFVSWEKSAQITMARNDTYWRGPSNLDKYIYKVVPKSDVLEAQLKTGEIDFGPLRESTYEDVIASGVNLAAFPVAIFLFYAYNQDPAKSSMGAAFQDKRVRQALLYALDRQKMVNSPAIFNKQAVVADSVMLPIWWSFNKDTTPKYPFDPAKAAQLLDDAGWKLNASTGIREKDGKPMKVKTTTNADRQVRPLVMNAMQEMWRKVGVDVSRNDLPTLAATAGVLTGERNFDILMIGFSFGVDPDESGIWHSRNTAPGGFNGYNFKNSTADQLLDDGVATLDKAKRKDIYFKFQNLMADEVPAPILFFNKGLWGVNKRVQNLNLDTYNQFGTRPWFNQVFVSDGK
jgi:peptide/nickel transport system substrate-binding protein